MQDPVEMQGIYFIDYQFIFMHYYCYTLSIGLQSLCNQQLVT